MNYSSLRDCIDDLEKNKHLVRIPDEVNPDLEIAEIHRRVFQVGGPALYFERVKGSPFPAVSNLFGTIERSRFIFRRTLGKIKTLFELKANPDQGVKHPLRAVSLASTLYSALPRKVASGPVFDSTTTLDQLPQIKCWPKDGGAFILLPQVYTEDLEKPGIMNSNLGMYRIQLSGNDYLKNQEVGIHYQIRRDIGIHHTKAKLAGKPLRASIFIGGPPAHTFSAVMYLPEALPEPAFAGALAGRRFRYAQRDGFTIAADADFCITGTIDPNATKPEGPFGDHLGYYSLKHPFPYMKVEKIYHRKDAIWPFTVVGRPPQEDTAFGKLIQEIAGPMIPKEIPGVKEVHAVDAAGVHPLLLAIGSERYTPYQERKPQELLTLANALLGYGPCSLAKYLFMVAGEDNPQLTTKNVADYFRHLLERVDWSRDLHFQTKTTIDTLDYSGTGINQGSKVVIAAAGEKRRSLSKQVSFFKNIPPGFGDLAIAFPGALVMTGPKFESYDAAPKQIENLTTHLESLEPDPGIPLIVLADDSSFVAKNINNFLWTTFTRSNPSHDIYGVRSFTRFKHWGCQGPLIIDARLKPHHAAPLIEDEKITRRVDSLAVSGKALHGIF